MAASILFLGFSLTDGAPFFTSDFFGSAMFWAILSYERKHYYRIIMELESELQELVNIEIQ
ncbi:MAG: hypothetical protein HOK97_11010 [Deltaproteobacteria bacterium]|nr:hypothetical protein [Deltaproteobacteria bacterium]MBT6490283.1 hypothetical protein [Deltaproteobacteria bacterium]